MAWVVLGVLTPDGIHDDALRLLYTYRHLQGGKLDNLPPTDLIQHRLRELVEQGIRGGIYERTSSANGRLSDWNAPAVLVDKVENPSPSDEPRLTFNYAPVHETMPGNHMELSSKVHDYLSNPRHRVFFSADIKHGYFDVLSLLFGEHFTSSEVRESTLHFHRSTLLVYKNSMIFTSLLSTNGPPKPRSPKVLPEQALAMDPLPTTNGRLSSGQRAKMEGASSEELIDLRRNIHRIGALSAATVDGELERLDEDIDFFEDPGLLSVDL